MQSTCEVPLRLCADHVVRKPGSIDEDPRPAAHYCKICRIGRVLIEPGGQASYTHAIGARGGGGEGRGGEKADKFFQATSRFHTHTAHIFPHHT